MEESKSVAVHQIYFDDKTKSHLEPEFIPYFNQNNTDYFENAVIKDVYEKINAIPEPLIQSGKYIGISSWKQRIKTHLTGADIISRIQKDIEEGKEKDVYLYPATSVVKFNYDNIPKGYDRNATIQAPDLWTQHKGWGEQVYGVDELLNNAGVLPFNIFDGKWIFSHCNYWIAKKEIFNEYCEKVLLPTMAFFEREDIKPLTPKWYTHSYAKEKYTSHSFVMEALFGAFLAHTDYSYSYICKRRTKSRKYYKMVNILGYERMESE